MNSYLQKKAAPWVSISVLAGGMLAAVLLVFLVRMENNIQALSFSESEYVEY